MTAAPAGWYPDPDNSGARRYWDGAQWAPAPAPKALAVTALVLAVSGPIIIVVLALVALAFNRLGYVMGMPNADDAIVEMMLRFAQIGAAGSIVFLVVAVILAIVASTRAARSRRMATASWIAIGGGVFFTGMTFLLPALL